MGIESQVTPEIMPSVLPVCYASYSYAQTPYFYSPYTTGIPLYSVQLPDTVAPPSVFSEDKDTTVSSQSSTSGAAPLQMSHCEYVTSNVAHGAAPGQLVPNQHNPIVYYMDSQANMPVQPQIPTSCSLSVPSSMVEGQNGENRMHQNLTEITKRMELVWHGEFNRLFSSFAHDAIWQLEPTLEPPDEKSWNIFKDSAKVRFTCQGCGHGWTSMKGRVVFWYQVYPAYPLKCGRVLFKIYGQMCQSCEGSRFEHAMWYPEEVIKVVGNLYHSVGQALYNFQCPPLRIDRRAGKPRSHHDSRHCQACADGICRDG